MEDSIIYKSFTKKRPRERLLDCGPESLQDYELLSILLNTGIHGKPVEVLSHDLLEKLDREKEIPAVKELCRLSGIGDAKACMVAAALELGRRRYGAQGTRIRHPSDIYNLVRHNADRKQERFICLSLNGAYEVLAIRVVTIGLVNRTIVHPREVFADALLDRAAAVIVAHNHPSGHLVPSTEDDLITERLQNAAAILGINFLDHLIFSESAWYSYRQSRRLSGEDSAG
ncbi:MAG: DNA repair protein RadC [Treponema sp.]|jgi:DNA repair protein RadC|nr:DNA repair protein RadC [Treponema sp.]